MTAPTSSTALSRKTPRSAEAPRPSPQAPPPATRARLSVLGASGYTGQEFVRLALSHPGLEIAQLVSREHAGRPAASLLVGADPAAALPTVVSVEAALEATAGEEVDTLVACLPHGVWKELGPRFESAAARRTSPLRILDLSSDHRDGAPGYVYGLPEAYRDGIAGATRLANPGCYPTAATLALLPALERGWIGGPIMVSALSGVSGAGRGALLRTSFVEREAGAELYRPGTEHPHVAEMVAQWSRLWGGVPRVGFAPQLVPMSRGILLVANVALAEPLEPEAVRSTYLERYAGEPFVRVLEPGRWPDTRSVRGSNRCDVAATTLHDGGTLLVTAAIDNLVKGAAGQALQNVNLMLGWPETTALPLGGTPW